MKKITFLFLLYVAAHFLASLFVLRFWMVPASEDLRMAIHHLVSGVVLLSALKIYFSTEDPGFVPWLSTKKLAQHTLLGIIIGLAVFSLPYGVEVVATGIVPFSKQVIFDAPGVFRSLAVQSIFVPVVEELFFRGAVLRWFDQKYGRTIAIVASTILFALAHRYWYAPIFLTGIIFGYTALRVRNIYPLIVGHMTHNALAHSVSGLVLNQLVLDIGWFISLLFPVTLLVSHFYIRKLASSQ